MNQRFVTVDMIQIEDAVKDTEAALAKLRKIVDRYNRAAESAATAYANGGDTKEVRS